MRIGADPCGSLRNPADWCGSSCPNLLIAIPHYSAPFRNIPRESAPTRTNPRNVQIHACGFVRIGADACEIMRNPAECCGSSYRKPLMAIPHHSAPFCRNQHQSASIRGRCGLVLAVLCGLVRFFCGLVRIPAESCQLVQILESETIDNHSAPFRTIAHHSAGIRTNPH